MSQEKIEDINKFIESLLFKCDNNIMIQYNDENPITDQICVTLITSNNEELSLFFKINNYSSNCVFKLNHYCEMTYLGNIKPQESDIIQILNSVEYEVGSLSNTNKIKQFLKSFKTELIELHPEMVLCKNQLFIKKYWRSIASGVGILAIGSYFIANQLL